MIYGGIITTLISYLPGNNLALNVKITLTSNFIKQTLILVRAETSDLPNNFHPTDDNSHKLNWESLDCNNVNHIFSQLLVMPTCYTFQKYET